MSQQATQFNPFMLMTHPEVVLAAMARSERLGQLNRQLCRPLDRPAGGAAAQQAAAEPEDDAEDGLIEP